MAIKILNDTTLQFFIDSILGRKLIPDEMLQAFVVAISNAVKQEPGIGLDDDFLELCDIVNDYWRNDRYMQTEDPVFIYQMGRLLSCVTLLSLLRSEED